MSNVKTAISIEKPLFDQAETLAQQMNVSRSRLYALALEDFIRRYENQLLLEQLNAAYDENASDLAEQDLQRRMRHLHQRIVEGEW